MASPLPLSGLPMAATAAVFKGPAPNGSVVVSTLVPAAALPLAEKDGMFRERPRARASPLTTRASRSRRPQHAQPEHEAGDGEARQAAGFRVISSIDLPPGRYTLRIGAREANSQKAGSVSYDLEVPDFAKEPFLMSGLALTSAASASGADRAPQGSAAAAAARAAHRLIASSRWVTRSRSSPRSTTTQATQPHKVDIARDGEGRGRADGVPDREERDSSELKGSAGGYGFTARIPLKDVAPGLYVHSRRSAVAARRQDRRRA